MAPTPTGYSFETPERSFRGVWVATVANIDWPKHPADSFEKKQAEYKALLAFYKDLNFNAVVVQVRTAGDAFYPTELAPWSAYLTGDQNKGPKTNLDPLKWLIDTTHAYGMDFHAWINPYRATMDLNTEMLNATHDFNTHRKWMVPYGNKYYYNPGLPEVGAHLVKIVAELVKEYPIDGLHLDDYFYPYKIEKETFNDNAQFKKYGNGASLATWRRQNIDQLIKNISTTIKSIKPWVSFGVSPFGVWKNSSTDPKGSLTKAGQTTYEDLYANPLLWMEKGWIDYLAPQLYWSMNYELAAHKTLVDWWAKQKTNSRIFIGNGAYKIYNNADKAWNNENEIIDQLNYAKTKPALEGHLFFSAKSLMNPKTALVVETLKKGPFKKASLPPLVNPKAKDTPFTTAFTFYKNKEGQLTATTTDPNIKQILYFKKDPVTNQYKWSHLKRLVKGTATAKVKGIEYIKGVNLQGHISHPIKVNFKHE